MKKDEKQGDINDAFNSAVGNKVKNEKVNWPEIWSSVLSFISDSFLYGGYKLFSYIRNFFFGKKPQKKNDESFVDLAITLTDAYIVNPQSELLSCSENLLKQQRMLEDTRARRRLEKWATKVIVFYLLFVFLLILLNGIVLVYHPIETIETFGKSTAVVKRGFISDSIMTVILSTTTINIIGLGIIVLKGHFDKDKNKSS